MALQMVMTTAELPEKRHGLTLASLSLSQRGTWGHIIVALILITILPLLITGWLWKSQLDGIGLPHALIAAAATIVTLLVFSGYGLLIKYPVSITRLRRYLQTLSAGDLPDQVSLTQNEDDIAAVQRHLEKVIALAEERIRLLEHKHQADLGLEKQRVMVESIGAMCHHLGQPATVMSLCLYRLKHNPAAADIPEIMREIEEAFDSMTAILDQLRDIPSYASEPYLSSSPQNPNESMTRILKL